MRLLEKPDIPKRKLDSLDINQKLQPPLNFYNPVALPNFKKSLQPVPQSHPTHSDSDSDTNKRKSRDESVSNSDTISPQSGIQPLLKKLKIQEPFIQKKKKRVTFAPEGKLELIKLFYPHPDLIQPVNPLKLKLLNKKTVHIRKTKRDIEHNEGRFAFAHHLDDIEPTTTTWQPPKCTLPPLLT